MMFKYGPVPKCIRCGRFIGNGRAIVNKNLDTFDEEPKFFEDMEPYCIKCWNRSFLDRMVSDHCG